MRLSQNCHPERVRQQRAAARLPAIAIGAILASAGNAHACAPPPAPVATLDLKRFYTDAKGSKVAEDIREANDRATQPVTDFLRAITKNADAALRTGSSRQTGPQASCALTWLQAWADAAALTGQMLSSSSEQSKQGEHHRKWALAGLALAYIKLKPFATPNQQSAIEPWLKTMADDARALFDNPGVKRNNHWYWLGLATGAVGLAANSERHWNTAREIFTDAAHDIAANGTLPLELERGARALSYHVFAVTPLVAMAELAAARGEDWYAIGNGALHRLVATTAEGLRSPAKIETLSGSIQKAPVQAGYGWITLYAARFPGRLGTPTLSDKPGYRWLGGDVRMLGPAAARLR